MENDFWETATGWSVFVTIWVLVLNIPALASLLWWELTAREGAQHAILFVTPFTMILRIVALNGLPASEAGAHKKGLCPICRRRATSAA